MIPGRCSGGRVGAELYLGGPGLAIVEAHLGILTHRLQPTGINQNHRAGGVLQQMGRRAPRCHRYGSGK